MAFDDTKDRIKERVLSLVARVQESTAWMSLTERYHSLSPAGQKVALSGAGLLFVAVLLLFPWIFYSSSEDTIADYEAKQKMIREMFQVAHAANSIPPPPPPVTATQLAGAARAVLQNVKIQPDQIVAVNEVPGFTLPGKKRSIQQAEIVVILGKLNLTQLLDAGQQLQTLQPLAKMIGVDVLASTVNNHLFDVTYKIAAFSGKPEELPKGGKAVKPARKE